MEPNKNQHNSQTALFAIAIILALGVGFYMGYQTGFVNGSSSMYGAMDSAVRTEDHMHTMMHGDTTEAGVHEHGAISSGGTSVADAMKMIDMGQ